MCSACVILARVSTPKELILALFAHAWGPSLTALAKPAQGLLELPDAVLRDALPALAVASEHEDAVAHALVAWLWSRNQFAELDEELQAELADSVESALHKLQTQPTRAAILPVLSTHRDELRALVRARFGNQPREVVCSEYSAELQLEVLGVPLAKLGELRQPVLDIGCGESAALVRFLRARGVAAQGLDRVVPSELGVTGDWLTFPYQELRPATALSHLGFSLHFLHHHLAGGDGAFAYARAYMTILRSLAARGRFLYTPGLPFLESMLDPLLYRVKRVNFASELRVPSLRQIEEATGLSLSYATHVERVS
ncbi:MAG: Methyltransferase type 11 [Myxococcaceae bacterium]|nr:Methyltransferase type 11 [Myxococcaceae bacterium]